MSAKLLVVFADGTTKLINEFDDIDEAVSAAFDLAETHGNDPGDGAGPPERIKVVAGNRTELSVMVMRGGLRPKRDGAK